MDKTIRLFETNSGSEQRILHGHRNGVNSIAFSFDGRFLASGGGGLGDREGPFTPKDYTMRFWNVKNGKLSLSLQGHRGQISSLAYF